MPANVQGKISSTFPAGTTTTIAFTTNVVAGNLICGVVAWYNLTPNLSTITDTLGNTYVISSTTSDGVQAQSANFYVKSIVSSGANTITFTFDAALGTQRVNMGVHEVSGCSPTSAVDGQQANVQNNAGTGTDAVTSGAAIVTTQDNDYIFGCTSASAAGTFSAGTGFTGVDLTTQLGTEYKILTPAGNAQVTFTWSGGTGRTHTHIMAFLSTGTPITGLGRKHQGFIYARPYL